MPESPFAWAHGPLRRTPGPGKVLYTTRRYPVFYLQITKCGCTFLRNLFYTLDHGRLHREAARIHSHDEDFLRADLIPRADLVRSPYLFAVIRDPVDRFLSLYFDKLANWQSPYDGAMRERVARLAGLDRAPGLDLDGHRENALRAVRWVGRNLDKGEGGKVNPHWQRQSVRLSRIEGLEPRLLTLDGLSWQLPEILRPVIPDIEAQMAAVTVRNLSAKPYSRAEMLTPQLQEAVNAVYADDADRYLVVRAIWGPPPRAEGN